MLKVNVSQYNIRKGIPRQEDECPINLAIRKNFKKESKLLDFLVTGAETQLIVEDKEGNIPSLVFKLPKKCCKFVERFDNGLKVKPFEFVLWDWQVKAIQEMYGQVAEEVASMHELVEDVY